MAKLVSHREGRRAYYQALGKRLTELRREREWTQAEVARLIHVSQQTMFAYELGDRKMPLDRAVQLAKGFDLSLAQLLGLLPVPSLQRGPISPRMVRHIQALRRLSVSDQRHIIELTKSLAKPSVLAARRPEPSHPPAE